MRKQECGGVRILVTDRNLLDAPELGIEVAAALQSLYPNDYKITGLDSLMVNKASWMGCLGQDPRRVANNGATRWNDSKDCAARY